MIEKLKEHDVIDPKTGNVIGKIGCDLREIMDKLNEVIDAANKHEDIIRQIGKWGSSKGECLWCGTLTEVNLDGENKTLQSIQTKPADNSEKANCQENVQDEFAEQRKWIGKACWFWDGNAQTKAFGQLNQIDPIDDGQHAPYQTNYGQWYERCEPANDDIIYKGE